MNSHFAFLRSVSSAASSGSQQLYWASPIVACIIVQRLTPSACVTISMTKRNVVVKNYGRDNSICRLWLPKRRVNREFERTGRNPDKPVSSYYVMKLSHHAGCKPGMLAAICVQPSGVNMSLPYLPTWQSCPQFRFRRVGNRIIHLFSQDAKSLWSLSTNWCLVIRWNSQCFGDKEQGTSESFIPIWLVYLCNAALLVENPALTVFVGTLPV